MLGRGIGDVPAGPRVRLNVRSELTLRNLRSFLAALEQLEGVHLRLPSYNTDAVWSDGANRARRLHDFTAALLVLASNAIALLALARVYPAEMGYRSPVAWVIAVVALGCVVAQLSLPRMAYRPSPPRRRPERVLGRPDGLRRAGAASDGCGAPPEP